jgi:NTE family protein
VTDETPLDSHAIGTSTSDLVKSCSPENSPRPTPPPAPPKDPPFALAFSGGGFRASLTALGVLRFMADAGLLAQVRWISSVSGGSVANGAFAVAYPELEQAGFTPEALEKHLVGPFVERISEKSMQKEMMSGIWRAVGRRTRTDHLADTLDKWFLGGLLLEQISPNVRFIFNASNLTTGVRFGFERDRFGDYVLGHLSTEGKGIRLAQAVAASASFPGAFAPVELDRFTFPCSNGRTAVLQDGGAYDNMGLEPVDDLNNPKVPADLRDACLVVANAGGVFRTGSFGGLPFLKNLQRVNSLLYRQSVVLRTRAMVDRFKAWEQAPDNAKPEWGRRGVLFSLATILPKEHATEWRGTRPEPPEQVLLDLAGTPTTFDEFRKQLCERLLYRGWWLTGATLSQYHRKLLPAELPSRPDPGA